MLVREIMINDLILVIPDKIKVSDIRNCLLRLLKFCRILEIFSLH